MVHARPSECTEIGFHLLQSLLKCLCSPSLLRSSFLPLCTGKFLFLAFVLNSKGSITYLNSSLGAHPSAAQALSYACTGKGRTHHNRELTLHCRLLWWPYSEVKSISGKFQLLTENFTHEFQLALF